VAPILLAAAGEAPAQERIPLEHFFRIPGPTALKLSPAGIHVAAISRADDVQRIVVMDLAARTWVDAFVLDHGPIWDFWWVKGERLLVAYAKDHGHSDQILTVDRDGSRLAKRAFENPGLRDLRGERVRKALRGLIQARGRPLHLLPDNPREVLLPLWGYSTRRLASSVAERVDVYTAVFHPRVGAQHEALYWLADPKGVVRLGYGQRGLDGYLLDRERDQSVFRETRSISGMEIDPWHAYPLGYRAGGASFLLASRHAGDRFVLHSLDPKTLAPSDPLFAHPRVDVDGPVVELHGEAFGIWYVEDHPRIHWLEAEWQGLAEEIDRRLPETVNSIVSFDWKRSKFVVRSQSDGVPPRYWLFSRDPPALELLARVHPELEGRSLAALEPVRYPARDGLEIPAYLALPAGPTGGAKPPLVVLVHDGPLLDPYGGSGGRVDRSFDPGVQFLASRGYAVLLPNFRGSGGFGLEYARRVHRQWGGAMQHDLADGVRWLVERGTVDGARVCISGGGYGGYAALLGLVRYPELFRCAASLSAITDLARFLTDRQETVYDEVWRIWIGDLGRDGERIRATSPLSQVEAIRAPVLLAHGKEDLVVEPHHSEALAAALARAGKEHELLLLDEEWHGLFWERNRLAFYRRLEGFLQKHLAP
jgi:dienelactone hydrolase